MSDGGLAPVQMRTLLLETAIRAYGAEGRGVYLTIKEQSFYIPVTLLDEMPSVTTQARSLLKRTADTYDPTREVVVFYLLDDDSERIEVYRQEPSGHIALRAPGAQG